MIFQYIKALKNAGIMGMNARNLDYVLRYNKRKYIELVDDKIKTKQLAQAANISVPELYNVIETEAQLANLQDYIGERNDFVIKPAHGTGGKGILIIKERIKHKYRMSNDTILTLEQLKTHTSKILSGVYSLGGYADKVIIEYRVITGDLFAAVTYHGVPDIRVVVYRGYPIMAMLRLPTIQSEGKANLHQGAIGVGINLATGITQLGVIKNQNLTEHPDTLNELGNIKISEWYKIMSISAKCFELTNLGYIGVDLVLDKKLGPMILEINARPGLNIQIANRDGLIKRIHMIDAVKKRQHTLEQKIVCSQTLFKGE